MRTRIGLVLAVLAAALPAPAVAATLHVTPGHSIQAAVDAARAGDTVMVEPGTYREKGRTCPGDKPHVCAVAITRDHISLVGDGTRKNPVVLVNPGKQGIGIAVGRTGSNSKCVSGKSKPIEGSLLQGFTVKGFVLDGVSLLCVNGWRVTDVHALRNRVYGIFPGPVGSGRVDHSSASGANDTGIYIGQSHDVRIDHNAASNNVSGFEIENSTRVVADHNTATGNTGGILSFTLPGLDVKFNSRNVIDSNVVHANNRKNTCLDPGDIVCNVPAGTGILLVAADLNSVHANDVRHNDTVGIAVVSYCIVAGGNPNCTKDIEPNPDKDVIRGNTAVHNAEHPDNRYAGIASDLVWDGTGHGNCWTRNIFVTSFPSPLPSCS